MLGLQEEAISDIEKAKREAEYSIRTGKGFIAVIDILQKMGKGTKDSLDNVEDIFNKYVKEADKRDKAISLYQYTNEDGKTEYSEKIPKNDKFNSYDINPKYEKIFRKHCEKNNVMYQAQKIDKDRLRITIVGGTKENVLKTMKGYIKDLDKLKNKDKFVNKNRHSYQDMKNKARTKMQQEEKTNPVDREIFKNKNINLGR